MSVIATFTEVSGSPESLVDADLEGLDIDKAWHGLYYLLTGEAEDAVGPLADAILGGVELDEQSGYEQARYLTPEEVRTISNALDAVDVEELKRHYDPEAMEMEEIYPEIWRADGVSAFDYLLGYFRELVAFYRRVAQRGHGVVLALK